MNDSTSTPRLNRSVVLQWAALLALCIVGMFVGLTTHGITSWHEAQRLVVSREMHAANEWIVPTINGRPYLAKPPLMYWLVMLAAEATGGEPGLAHLRFVVAASVTVSVLGLWFFARRLFGAWSVPHASEAAFWAAAMLGTGTLVVRSARIAEIDALLLPVGVFGVGSIMLAWRAHRDHRRTAWGWVLLATLCGIAGTLSKSVPGLIVLAVAAYGAIAAYTAWTRTPLDTSPALPGVRRRPLRDAGPAGSRAAWSIGAIAGLAAAAGLLAMNPFRGVNLASALALGLLIAPAAATLVRLAQPARAAALFAAYSRTHPVLVLGAPLAALWGWQRLASGRVGADVAADQVAQEVESNFAVLPASNPIKMVEAASYGVGLASIVCIVAVGLAVHRVRLKHWPWPRFDRRLGFLTPLLPGAGTGNDSSRGPSALLCLVLAWTLGGVLIFAVAGNGHGRYLTPFWPGFALGGGWFVARAMDRLPRSRRAIKRVLVAAVVALAIGQGIWYGWARERYYAFRSPRALAAELLARSDIDPARICTLGFYRVAIDAYLGHPTQPVDDVGRREALIGIRSWTLAELHTHARQGGTWTVLITDDEDGAATTRGEKRLLDAGFIVRPLDLGAAFHVGDNNASRVRAVRVIAPRSVSAGG